MTREEAYAALISGNTSEAREAVKRLFDLAAEDKRHEPDFVLRTLAETAQQRAALKRQLDDDERQWLEEKLQLCEAASSAIKSLLPAPETESLRLRSERLRSEAAQLRREARLGGLNGDH